jgi:gamma-glutamylcyclotransferase (GGCT)/AIG2-like uncharacterized protein YtfP
MFTYGTLMHYPDGAPMRDWTAAGETEPYVDGTATGTLLNAGPFPYADFDGSGLIYGQVLTFDEDSWTYKRIVHMEEGAGYVAREVIVETASGPVVCTAWQIAPDRVRWAYESMPVIESGDWLEHIGVRRPVMD